MIFGAKLRNDERKITVCKIYRYMAGYVWDTVRYIWATTWFSNHSNVNDEKKYTSGSKELSWIFMGNIHHWSLIFYFVDLLIYEPRKYDFQLFIFMPPSFGAGGFMFPCCPPLLPSVCLLKARRNNLSACTWVRWFIRPTVIIFRCLHL